MSLQAVYERFLASPAAAPLARDVSLNYITTTTSVNGADAVLSHLQRQQKIVEKKGDKTLSAIETADALVLDVDTTLAFVSGGGAYLPSLDDNFLADRVVTFPTVHIVRFDAQGLIQQIRIYWDQGSLLKQVDVIGSRGRNWPIRDAKDQSKLITNVITAQGSSAAPSSQNTTQQQEQNQPAASRSASPSKRHVRDPHASLSLFGGDEEDQPQSTVVAPYAPSSARPPVRDPTEILTGGYDENDTPTSPQKGVISPRAGANKHFGPIRVFGEDSDEPVPGAVQPRAGSSKNFQPIRVFDTEEDPAQADEQQTSRSHVQPKVGSNKNFKPINLFGEGDGEAPKEQEGPRYKTHPKKFSHFDMGEAEDAEKTDRPARKFRPLSQWDFADFSTPEKPRNKVLPQDVRHFGWSDNEEEVAETPQARPRVVQPRRDAETHFTLADEDNSATDNNNNNTHKPQRSLGNAHNKGLGLYENNLYDENGNLTPLEKSEPKQPLGIVPNNTFRRKDFDSHWDITDSMPPEDGESAPKKESKPISSDRMKAVNMMNASWDNYEDGESQQPKQSAPKPAIKRSTFQPSWGFGDE